MGKESIHLRRVFDLFDSNGDGEITAAELGQIFRRLRSNVEAEELDKMMAAFVKPGRCTLQFDDFAFMMESSMFGEEDMETTEESDLREAFTVFDEDGDGYISDRELQSVLGKLGLSEGKNMEGVRKMICSVDANHDGRVDFEEFKHMMREIPLKSSGS